MTLSIAIRVDASLDIGTGHVMRCLTLANALRAHGAHTCFICKPHTGHLVELIRQHGHEVETLELPIESGLLDSADEYLLPSHAHWLGDSWYEDAGRTIAFLRSRSVDWLIVDHYALDVRWESALRPYCAKLMVIDDLADRNHDCDLLLDQNLGRTAGDYQGLIPKHVRALVGPKYALLRPEFVQLRPQSLARRAKLQLKHLLIAMGGVDKENVAGQVLDATKTCTLPVGLHISVVMGPNSPCLAQVRAQAEQMPWPTSVLVGVNNMAQLMAESDLAIGAAGGTAWERCCLGLPSLVLVLAENQLPGAAALQNAGAAVVLRSGVDLSLFMQNEPFNDSGLMKLHRMGIDAAKLTDGAGASRVVEQLMSNHV